MALYKRGKANRKKASGLVIVLTFYKGHQSVSMYSLLPATLSYSANLFIIGNLLLQAENLLEEMNWYQIYFKYEHFFNVYFLSLQFYLFYSLFGKCRYQHYLVALTMLTIFLF